MAINRQATLDWLATDLPVEDDTEESVMGSDLHQQAVREAHMSLWEYAASLGTTEQPAWYVSSEVTVIVPLPRRRARAWHPKPDVFVVPGVSAQPRSSYDTRTEGPMPAFVLEVASESTWGKDVGDKVAFYAAAGVREYLVFDPTGAYLRDPPIRGWHVADGIWQPWEPMTRGDGALVWESVVLGLMARPEGVLLRFDHPQRGPLPIRSDLHRALAHEAEALAREADARRAAEERAARQEAARQAAEEQAARQAVELEAARAEIARLRAWRDDES